MGQSGTIDDAEVAKFEAVAEEWWDPEGSQAALHRLNPIRLDYIADRIAAAHGRDRRARAPFAGLDVVDVGCGGGLAAEPMARLGARVTGIDAAEGNIRAARAHADRMGLTIEYGATTAEALAGEGLTFDAVLALEIVEHVADLPAFLAAVAALVRPGGVLIVSTLNRTAASFALGIVAAERVLGWLPRGTHDWRRFVTPAELRSGVEAQGLTWVQARGMLFDPVRWDWRLSDRDLSVNYIAAAERAAGEAGP